MFQVERYLLIQIRKDYKVYTYKEPIEIENKLNYNIEIIFKLTLFIAIII